MLWLLRQNLGEQVPSGRVEGEDVAEASEGF
jgi:hypothetical protein